MLEKLNRIKSRDVTRKIRLVYILIMVISLLLCSCNIQNKNVLEEDYTTQQKEDNSVLHGKESHESIIVDNYEEALKFGKEKLIEKYPDIIFEEGEFIGYKFNGVWHVQNFIKHTSENPYVYLNDYGYVFNNLETTKYIKFMDNDFNEILMYGGFEFNEEFKLLDIYTIGGFLNAGEIANQIITNKYDANYNKVYYNQMSGGMWTLYVLPDMSDVDEGYAIAHSAEGVINIRDKDGMILFFNYE